MTESKEKNLPVADDKYRMLYELSSDAMMTLEPPDWHFTDCNPATLKIFGVESVEKFISLTPYDLSPEKQPDDELSSTKSIKMIKKALDSGQNIFEWTHKRYKGGTFAAEVTLSKIKIADQNIIQATVRDITKRKLIEEKNLVLSSIVENAADSIISKDLEGNILSANQSVETLYGYKPDELIGKNISLLLPEDKKNEVKDILVKISKGEKIGHLETKRVKKDGTLINVSLTISPVKNSFGRIIGASTIAHDITKEIEKVKDLEKLNKLMVGRELKMIELKQEIAHLESTGKEIKEDNIYQKGIDLEEKVIQDLRNQYEQAIKDIRIDQNTSDKIIEKLETLRHDSEKHERLLKELANHDQ